MTGRLVAFVAGALGLVWLADRLTGAATLVLLVAAGLGLIGRHLRRTGG